MYVPCNAQMSQPPMEDTFFHIKPLLVKYMCELNKTIVNIYIVLVFCKL